MSSTNIIALVLLIVLLVIFFSIRFEVRTTREMDTAAMGCAATGDNSRKNARDTMRGYYNWAVGQDDGAEAFVGSNRPYDGEYA